MKTNPLRTNLIVKYIFYFYTLVRLNKKLIHFARLYLATLFQKLASICIL